MEALEAPHLGNIRGVGLEDADETTDECLLFLGCLPQGRKEAHIIEAAGASEGHPEVSSIQLPACHQVQKEGIEAERKPLGEKVTEDISHSQQDAEAVDC